jgi:hypothetical protein
MVGLELPLELLSYGGQALLSFIVKGEMRKTRFVKIDERRLSAFFFSGPEGQMQKALVEAGADNAARQCQNLNFHGKIFDSTYTAPAGLDEGVAKAVASQPLG